MHTFVCVRMPNVLITSISPSGTFQRKLKSSPQSADIFRADATSIREPGEVLSRANEKVHSVGAVFRERKPMRMGQ